MALSCRTTGVVECSFALIDLTFELPNGSLQIHGVLANLVRSVSFSLDDKLNVCQLAAKL
jgi:hypothetical protein